MIHTKKKLLQIDGENLHVMNKFAQIMTGTFPVRGDAVIMRRRAQQRGYK